MMIYVYNLPAARLNSWMLIIITACTCIARAIATALLIAIALLIYDEIHLFLLIMRKSEKPHQNVTIGFTAKNIHVII